MDFRNDPDGDYKWIMHICDHFSKYSCAYALTAKESEQVANALTNWLSHFGPPKILQCDNGSEFKGALLLLLKRYGIPIINGRPRHPETQGLVEKANGTFKRKLRAWKNDNPEKASQWASALPEICLAINNQRHSTTNYTPYEIVFKQKMNTHRLSIPDREDATVFEEEEGNNPEGTREEGDRHCKY